MESLVSFLVWSLAVFGAANGIAVSALLAPTRNWLGSKSAFLGKLVHCAMCLGFWIGMIAGLTMYSPTGAFVWDGFLGSITSWILFLTIKDLQFE